MRRRIQTLEKLLFRGLASIGLLIALGCNQDEVRVYRVEKTKPPERDSAGNRQIAWTLPEGWVEAPATGLRRATLKPPFPGTVEASVVTLQGKAGGELANVNRWRSQLGLSPVAASNLASIRRIVNAPAGPLAVFDFTSENAPKLRLVAACLTRADGSTWFFKLAGNAEPVGQAKPGFLKLLETIHLG